MPATELVIPQPTAALPSCTPNLMPFHINYTGPAAVSAFMRVRKLVVEELEKEPGETEAVNEPSASVAKEEGQEVKEDVEMASSAQDDSLTTKLNVDVDPEATLVASTSSESQTTIAASESQIPSLLSAASSLATLAPTPTPAPPPIEDADKRFVSAFRGRTIHGLTIDLPAGLTGLVLQSEIRDQGTSKGPGAAADGKTGAKSKAEAKRTSARGKAKAEETDAPSTRRRGRLTRSTLPASNATKPTEVPGDDRGDEVMDNATTGNGAAPKDDDDTAVPDAEGEDNDDEANTRRLIPTAQFSEFTLWSADRLVDKGRDEYYRSLTEWVALANEIHRIE